MHKLIILLFVCILFSCTTKTPRESVTKKYCLGHVNSFYFNSFVRNADVFLNEFLLNKIQSENRNLASVSNFNEDLVLFRQPDAIALLYKKYEMGEPETEARDLGKELDKHTFVMFNEMSHKKYESLKKDINNNENRICFFTDIPLKKDSYPGVEIFFAKDYEIQLSKR